MVDIRIYCSKNGTVCLERLARYKKLIGPMTFQIRRDHCAESIVLQPRDKSLQMPSFLVQAEFSFLIGMLRHATKLDCSPLSIRIREPLKDAGFSIFTGVTPIICEENSITFSNAVLEEPFISHNEAMWAYFEPEMNKRLVDLSVDDSISARVRSALTELLPGGSSSIDDVAEKLGISKRTLQRKLFDEGTSFQKQLNSIREVLALHYVKNTDFGTNDIAYLLGYEELNSFLRAFTIWTGMNLTKYRKLSS